MVSGGASTYHGEYARERSRLKDRRGSGQDDFFRGGCGGSGRHMSGSNRQGVNAKTLLCSAQAQRLTPKPPDKGLSEIGDIWAKCNCYIATCVAESSRQRLIDREGNHISTDMTHPIVCLLLCTFLSKLTFIQLTSNHVTHVWTSGLERRRLQLNNVKLDIMVEPAVACLTPPRIENGSAAVEKLSHMQHLSANFQFKVCKPPHKHSLQNLRIDQNNSQLCRGQTVTPLQNLISIRKQITQQVQLRTSAEHCDCQYAFEVVDVTHKYPETLKCYQQ